MSLSCKFSLVTLHPFVHQLPSCQSDQVHVHDHFHHIFQAVHISAVAVHQNVFVCHTIFCTQAQPQPHPPHPPHHQLQELVVANQFQACHHCVQTSHDVFITQAQLNVLEYNISQNQLFHLLPQPHHHHQASDEELPRPHVQILQ